MKIKCLAILIPTLFSFPIFASSDSDSGLTPGEHAVIDMETWYAVQASKAALHRSHTELNKFTETGSLSPEDFFKAQKSIADVNQYLTNIENLMRPGRRTGSNPGNMYKLRDFKLLKNEGDISADAFDGL